MLAFLKLIRIQNLIIVAVTQYLMRYAIIEPILKINNFELQLSNFNFFILVFSTVLLTAAGYVINDYFDTKTDILNRPDSVVVGRKIGRRTAMTIHLIFNIIAIIGGFYISYKIGLYQLGFIFFLVSGILWYYSTSYKRQFLIGNLIVAILTGLVPLMVILFEMPVLNKEYYEILLAKKANFNHVFFWVAGFSFFAFITTLIREIVKDMQDYEGDSAYGRNTLPIILGIFYTKLVVSILIILTLISLAYVYFKFLIGSDLTLWYIIIGEISPLLFISFKLITAKNKDDYKFISTLLKIIMLIGILYSLVEAYIFTYNF
ncbi:MAG: geranylgeranylglycerol-phosphate geranylgeranyltransferase [Bacteroidales bacterium]|nr:geranylgeranylglycerol-phosphate geranylgeranyltransferase [Bacteroidales bacterium]